MESESDPITTDTRERVAVAYIEEHGTGWKLVFKDSQQDRLDGRIQFPKISFVKSVSKTLGAAADGKIEVQSSAVSEGPVPVEIKQSVNSKHHILEPKSAGDQFSSILDESAATDNRNRSKTLQSSKKMKCTDYPDSNVHVQCDPLEISSIDKEQILLGSLESHAPEETLVPSTQEANKKLYKCPICETSFFRLRTFKYHVRIHEKAKATFHCTLCAKTFPNHSKLLSHENYHRLEKLFKCKFCDKSFNLPLNLKVHMRSHTGERPYDCNFCGKPFSQIGNLNVHLKTHTGEKPFQCSPCGKSFIRLADLRNHNKIHHTGKKLNRSSSGPKSIIRLTGPQAHRKTPIGHETKTNALPQPQAKRVVKKVRIVKTHSDQDRTLSRKIQRPDSTKELTGDGAKISKTQTRDTREKPFRCSTCFKSFYRSELLLQHSKTHLLV